MKLELTKDDANSLGAVLVALKNAKPLNEKKESLVFGEFVTLYQHVDKVFKLRQRILDAEQSDLSAATPIQTELEASKDESKGEK